MYEFRVPFFSDPRLNKNLNKKEQEIAFKQLIKQNRNFDPLKMNDEQPEKWAFLANNYLMTAEELESNPNVRYQILKRVNDYLSLNDFNIYEMIDLELEEESDLFNAYLKYSSCVNMQLYLTGKYNQKGLQSSILITRIITGQTSMISF